MVSRRVLLVILMMLQQLFASVVTVTSSQCIAAAQGAGASNRNDASQQQLINHCKVRLLHDLLYSSGDQDVINCSQWQSKSVDWYNQFEQV